MSCISSIEINRRIRSVVDGKLTHLPYDKRANIIATAIGFAIGTSLPLPTSPVALADQFISDSILQSSDTLSIINEAFVLDTSMAMSTAKAVLRFRYDTVFTPQNFFTFLLAENPAAGIGLCGETINNLRGCPAATLIELGLLIDRIKEPSAQ